jgi:hypothetical protein
MRKISKIVFIILLFSSPLTLFSQEVVSSLEGNAVAERYYSAHQKFKKSINPGDTIELPFIDDFSDSYVEPKQSLWSDNYAFINSTYAIYPPTVGVATLDALDYNGSQYPHAGFLPYQADYLTSRPINLDYPPTDNIYLSFYYQPGGLAESPETGDSLILDFYSADSLAWEKVWSVPGPGVSENFKRVMIKIEREEYLKKGFRLRFRNYASHLSNPDLYDKRANIDFWHIDYVKLDRNRELSDTVLRDVAFMEPMKGILKEYSSLPWLHFEDAYNTQRAPFIEVLIQNHDTLSRNVGKALEMKDLFRNKPVYKLSPLYNTIASGDSTNYKYAYNYPFDFAPVDSAAFEIKAILLNDFFDYKTNDTLLYIQKFYDYYALDDGTAEASYGLRGSGTKDASSAIKFNSYIGDTLRAIDMYFVQIVDSLNLDYYFYLNVWADNNGKPGASLVNQIGMRPSYSEKLNKFVRYKLETPIFIEGPFYIGFTQTNELLLNIGYDLNRPNQSKIFYNSSNGVWKNTSLKGTPMMHPVLSQNVRLGNKSIQFPSLFEAYPNPASDFITISTDEIYMQSKSVTVDLIDLYGRVLKSINPFVESTIETGKIQNGVYFLRLNDPELNRISTKKIIINH